MGKDLSNRMCRIVVYLSDDFHFRSRLLEQSFASTKIISLIFDYCNSNPSFNAPRVTRGAEISLRDFFTREFQGDNPYHPYRFASSRCFLLFSSRWRGNRGGYTRAPLWPRCVVVGVEKTKEKKLKISVPTAMHSSARDTPGCQHRRVVDTFCSEGGGTPCRLSQLTCSVFLFYFRRFLFCARHATPHVPPPPPPPADPRTEPALCFDHVTPPHSKDGLSALPRDTRRSF